MVREALKRSVMALTLSVSVAMSAGAFSLDESRDFTNDLADKVSNFTSGTMLPFSGTIKEERPNAPKVNLDRLTDVVQTNSAISYIKESNEKTTSTVSKVAVSSSPDVVISKEYNADTLRHQRKVIDLGNHDVCFLTASSHWGDDGAYCYLQSYDDGSGKLHWKLYSWCEDDPITHCRARCLDGTKLAYADRNVSSSYFNNNFASDDEISKLQEELEDKIKQLEEEIGSSSGSSLPLPLVAVRLGVANFEQKYRETTYYEYFYVRDGYSMNVYLDHSYPPTTCINVLDSQGSPVFKECYEFFPKSFAKIVKVAPVSGGKIYKIYVYLFDSALSSSLLGEKRFETASGYSWTGNYLLKGSF